MAQNEPGWLERPQTIRKIVWALVAVCAALLLADFFYHKHVHFEFEHWFGFFAFYGFFYVRGAGAGRQADAGVSETRRRLL